MFTEKEVKAIKGFIFKTVRGLTLRNASFRSDLEQEGWVKALELEKSFKRDSGNKFLTYAGPYIKLHMLSKLSEWTHTFSIPKNIKDVKASIIMKYNSMEYDALSNDSKIKRLSKEYRISEEDIRACVSDNSELYDEEKTQTSTHEIDFAKIADLEIIKDFLGQFAKDKDFQLFFQVKVMDQSIALVAKKTGISRQTAFYKINRMMKLLKEELQKQFPELL